MKKKKKKSEYDHIEYYGIFFCVMAIFKFAFILLFIHDYCLTINWFHGIDNTKLYIQNTY